jgi:hypothetical protein
MNVARFKYMGEFKGADGLECMVRFKCVFGFKSVVGIKSWQVCG